MYIYQRNHSGFKCGDCDKHLSMDKRLIPGPGIFCTTCNAVTTNLVHVNLHEVYKDRPEDIGFWVPDEIKEELPKPVQFSPILVKLLLETVGATHDTDNDPRLALEILICFYRKYSSDLYRLAQLLEKSKDLSEDDETMVRIFYGCKENYHDFKDS